MGPIWLSAQTVFLIRTMYAVMWEEGASRKCFSVVPHAVRWIMVLPLRYSEIIDLFSLIRMRYMYIFF
jgi:hypothetical protein